MLRKHLFLMLVSVALAACTQNTPVETIVPETAVPSETAVPTNQDNAGLPNPASVYCEEQGYTLEIRTAEDGSQSGVCLFPDGSECEEWAYYRDECRPGDSLATPAAATDSWQLYQNETLSYAFDYPGDAIVYLGDDPRQSITVQGPITDDEYWPVIYVSHPQDEAAYRPPQGVDLAQWLTEHNLLPPADQTGVETRQADVQIAAETAVHTRFDRSPHSYAFDKYFFAHDGQLYTIVILHTGDHEDWALYDRFLSSFHFES